MVMDNSNSMTTTTVQNIVRLRLVLILQPKIKNKKISANSQSCISMHVFHTLMVHHTNLILKHAACTFGAHPSLGTLGQSAAGELHTESLQLVN